MLIDIPSSENAEWPWSNQSEEEAAKIFAKTFPAIYKHMLDFEPHLRKRQDQGKYWWELRSCAYYKFLRGPKILVQSIAYHSVFCSACESDLLNNSMFFVPTNDVRILSILNSHIAWWYMSRCFPHKKDEAIAMDSAVLATLPAPETLGKDRLIQGSGLLVGLADKLHAWEEATLHTARTKFGLDEADRTLLSWLPSPKEVFARRLSRLVDQGRPSAAVIAEMVAFQRGARAEQIELLTRQLALEKKLATLVEDAYGLTPDDRQLLRATRPIRDPLDVLEAKIRGGAASDAADATDEG